MTAFFVTATPELKPQSQPQELKTRLDWGEPALTIIDVRDRAAFNQARIQGAISMPLSTLMEKAMETLETERDIYVYGASDEETADAAQRLRSAGYQQVSELLGGVSAWKSAMYPSEGV